MESERESEGGGGGAEQPQTSKYAVFSANLFYWPFQSWVLFRGPLVLRCDSQNPGYAVRLRARSAEDIGPIDVLLIDCLSYVNP